MTVSIPGVTIILQKMIYTVYLSAVSPGMTVIVQKMKYILCTCQHYLQEWPLSYRKWYNYTVYLSTVSPGMTVIVQKMKYILCTCQHYLQEWPLSYRKRDIYCVPASSIPRSELCPGLWHSDLHTDQSGFAQGRTWWQTPRVRHSGFQTLSPPDLGAQFSSLCWGLRVSSQEPGHSQCSINAMYGLNPCDK